RVVVEEVPLGEREVEQDLAMLAPARRVQVIREPVLGDRRWDSNATSGALDRDRVELSVLREDVVDVVHHVGHDDTVNGRWGRALRKDRPTARTDRAAKHEHTTRDSP